MYQCVCGKSFKNNSGLVVHSKYCDGIGTKKDKCIDSKNWHCPKCNKHIHSRKDRHVEICDGLGAGAHRRTNKGKGPGQGWTKGKTYKEIYGSERAAEIISKIKTVTPKKLEALADPEYRKRLSENAKRHGLGGPTKRGGRGKHGWYKGIWCDSSWELAWVIYNLDHEVPFTRNREGFTYEINGKGRKYYPDFLLPDGTYVEIKGWMTDEFKKKMEQFPHPLRVLMNDDLKPILEYVKNSYGKDFTKLYETR